jgi:integrase
LTLKNLREALSTDEGLIEIFNKNREIVVEKDYIPPFRFIEDYISKSNLTTGTKKDLNNTLNHLKDFDAYRGKTASWKSMGYEYYLDLVNYLKTVGKKGSTIDKIVKNLKTFLTQADLTDNLVVNQDFKKKVSGRSLFAKINKEEAEHVYLNEDEIRLITNTKLDDRLAEIRDLFLIGCWTGLRISDLSRLKSENIKDGLVSIRTQKTREGVVVPVTDELQAVLDKYPERLPKIPTDQYYNRQLKDVCRLSGLDEPVMAEVRKGDLTVIAPVPKWQLVTSHTARRSFATNLYRRGIPSTQLMFLTGHRTEDAFLKYIKVSKEDNAKDVAKKLKKIG